MQPTCSSKSTANEFNKRKKINLMLIFEMTGEFIFQIINSLCILETVSGLDIQIINSPL